MCILFIACDPGAVNCLIPVIRELDESQEPKAVVVSCKNTRHLFDNSGIRSIRFESYGDEVDPREGVERLVAYYCPELLVVGASRPNNALTVEQCAIILGKDNNIPSICVLDYWGGYRDRFNPEFVVKGIRLVPDYVCALDATSAESLVAAGVPEENIRITLNPKFDVLYSQSLNDMISNDYDVNKLRILFISQPLKQKGYKLRHGFHELDVFEMLIDSIAVITEQCSVEIAVWKHPLEEGVDWLRQIRKHNENAKVKVYVQNSRGWETMMKHDIVVSAFSTVLYDSVHYEIPSLSIQPGKQGGDELITNYYGLSVACYTNEEVIDFFSNLDLQSERVRLRSKKRQLRKEGLFFSDGMAANRIVNLVECAIREERKPEKDSS